MLGVDPDTKDRGGIWMVIDVYRRKGLFEACPICYIGTYTSGSKTKKLSIALNAISKVAWLLITGRVALFHVHSASNASFWRKSIFVLAAFIWRCPVVFHLHGGGFENFYNLKCRTVGRWYVRFILDRASVIVVVSEGWRKRISRITLNKNINVIPNPVDPTVLPLDVKCKIKNRSKVVLFLGRVSERKGIVELVDAAKIIRERIPDIKIWFAGSGDLDIVRARANEIDIMGNIEFLGWVGGEQKRRAFQEASVYALPSYAEGLPMGILEAMANGLPIVASRVGGIPDIVEDGVNGILVEPRDPNGLATALYRVLQDEELARRMGEISIRRIADNHVPSRVIAKVEAMYAQILGRGCS